MNFFGGGKSLWINCMNYKFLNPGDIYKFYHQPLRQNIKVDPPNLYIPWTINSGMQQNVAKTEDTLAILLFQLQYRESCSMAVSVHCT